MSEKAWFRQMQQASLPRCFLIGLLHREKRFHPWSTSPKQSCGKEESQHSHNIEGRNDQVVAAQIIVRSQNAVLAHVMGHGKQPLWQLGDFNQRPANQEHCECTAHKEY